MAKQTANPGTWHDRFSDGCSGVMDFEWVNAGILRVCRIHDCDYWWGGSTAEEKLKADTALYKNTGDAGWLGHFLAPIRYRGVRLLTWNYPPKKGSLGGPPERRYDTMFEALKHGQTRVAAFNFLGPGRGPHANMEAQDHLLPEQMPVVAAAREVA